MSWLIKTRETALRTVSGKVRCGVGGPEIWLKNNTAVKDVMVAAQ